jgi:hypothetical protein
VKLSRIGAVGLGLLILAAAGGARSAPSPSEDPLAAEIARWQTFVATHRSGNDTWADVKESSEKMLASAAASLQRGDRELALMRLAAVRINLAAAEYLDSRPAAELQSPEAFEAEWKRVGEVLRADLAAPSPDALSGVRPAAARAVAEVARLQLREYYDSALEYGRSTMAQYGLFYVGAALAQRDFVAFAGTLHEPGSKPLPAVRPLAPELDGLEDALLAAYRPPASIERHADFIGASASLKEARELDRAGFRYGALYKYLQAAQRLPIAHEDAGVAARLDALAKRLADSPSDASIGILYLDLARADLAASKPGAPAAAAAAIADDVLPRYFAALAPAPPPPAPRPPAEVTVTLVRWPYT